MIALNRFLQSKKVLIALFLVLLLALMWSKFAVSHSSDLAFPGAEGFGASSIGGRNGKTIEVTNLNDRGVGSLRAAIDTQEPRTIIFRVGGTITLDSSLRIRHPYITIAGQTAPNGGITLRNSPKNTEAPLKIETHDVIVRYLRSRPGSNPNESGNLDALSIAGKKGKVYNIMIDHCSLSWATDEVISTFYDARNVTIQWSIISEGLDCSTHTENGKRQCHSMGMLLGSEGSKNISIHHNLFAHNRRRNPLVKNSGVTDIVNNVIYNSGFGTNSFSPTQVMGTYGKINVNYVGNYFKPGVDTRSADWLIDTKEEPVNLYVKDNQVPRSTLHPDSFRWLVRDRHNAPKITTTSAQTAYEQVLANAGASCSLNSTGQPKFYRDAIDDRIIADVRHGTGRIINDPSEVGGWSETLKSDQASAKDSNATCGA